jgi:hypothetical protein
MKLDLYFPCHDKIKGASMSSSSSPGPSSTTTTSITTTSDVIIDTESTLGIDIGIKNLSQCIFNTKTRLPLLRQEWKSIDLRQLCGIPNKSCKSIKTTEIQHMLSYILPILFPAEYFVKYHITHAGIEAQPKKKIHILISYIIKQYLQGLIDRDDNPLQGVFLIAGAKKYDDLDAYGIQHQKIYKNRKDSGVLLVRHIFHELKYTWNRFKKMDDDADSYLLARVTANLWFPDRRPPLPTTPPPELPPLAKLPRAKRKTKTQSKDLTDSQSSSPSKRKRTSKSKTNKPKRKTSSSSSLDKKQNNRRRKKTGKDPCDCSDSDFDPNTQSKSESRSSSSSESD